jgi:uncharacterized membrane protein YedE/YeeE
MDMSSFTPGSALCGGALIGLGASLLVWSTGKTAGISGILAGLLQFARGDVWWRVAFVAGLIVVGAAAALLEPASVANTAPRSLPVLVVAGLLAGIGTRVGNGCTSGHGVVGLSRFSLRSLVATATFIAAGALTVFAVRALFGGAL